MTASCVDMVLLQQILTFLLPTFEDGLSLNSKMDLLDLISQRALRPFSLADAKILATSLFHDTEVMYEPSCGFLFPGFLISGWEMSLPMSRINKSVEPKARKLFLSEFHSAHMMG